MESEGSQKGPTQQPSGTRVASPVDREERVIGTGEGEKATPRDGRPNSAATHGRGGGGGWGGGSWWGKPICLTGTKPSIASTRQLPALPLAMGSPDKNLPKSQARKKTLAAEREK